MNGGKDEKIQRRKRKKKKRWSLIQHSSDPRRFLASEDQYQVRNYVLDIDYVPLSKKGGEEGKGS